MGADSEFSNLVDAARRVHERRGPTPRSEWDGSPFEWIMDLASRSKGKAFEEIAREYLERRGFRVRKAENREHDLMIEDSPVEVKGSTLWRSGQYRFQQIRRQVGYDLVLCLGLSPRDASCWAVPRRRLVSESGEFATGLPGFSPQHSGKTGRDTAWLAVAPDDPPPWLAEFGGPLDRAVYALRRLTLGGGRPPGRGD